MDSIISINIFQADKISKINCAPFHFLYVIYPNIIFNFLTNNLLFDKFPSVKQVSPYVPGKTCGWLVPTKTNTINTPSVKVELHGDESFTVGRELNCNFPLADSMFEKEENRQYNKASRHHFKIHLECGQFFLTNMSSNGTFVNGMKIEKHFLSHGDKISILENDFEIFHFHVDQI